MNPVAAQLRRLWMHGKAIGSLKVGSALLAVIWLSLYWERQQWLIGLILGVIAAALAETDDRPAGRLRAVLVMLPSFAIVAFAVQWLFPWPALFVLGLALSSFAFVMLGAMGERYATLSVAALILAVYTMLGLSQHQLQALPFWHEPALLLGGATIYSAISLLASLLFINRPPRQAMARVYLALANYLALKARLLSPTPGRDVDSLRLALAEQNARLVGDLNRARQILIAWQLGGRISAETNRLLKWYFAAQDIHERASSAHHPYQVLGETFARSDILFRCAHLMQAQASYCEALAGAIVNGEFAPSPAASDASLYELERSQRHAQTHYADSGDLIEALADISRNLTHIALSLRHIADPFACTAQTLGRLRDANPRNLQEMLLRVRQQLTPNSSRFRHGVRLSLALTAGYGLIHLLDLPQGYWVLLTTVFVCQPQYSSTWRRLGERVSGTLLGLLAASLFIAAFAHPTAQLAMIVASGVAFFALRNDRYLMATACITVLVMMCFNQFGSSYAMVLPRLIDTVLGALLAGLAVAFILPEWQGQRLHLVMANSLRMNARYLGEILSQYQHGKRDTLAYRIARREAHNADAELSITLSAMLGEPRYRTRSREGNLFLGASHALLGYISALGAHREHLTDLQPQARSLTSSIQQALNELASNLQQGQAPAADIRIEAAPEETRPLPLDASERRLIRQLQLIAQQVPELHARVRSLFATSADPQREQLPR